MTLAFVAALVTSAPFQADPWVHLTYLQKSGSRWRFMGRALNKTTIAGTTRYLPGPAYQIGLEGAISSAVISPKHDYMAFVSSRNLYLAPVTLDRSLTARIRFNSTIGNFSGRLIAGVQRIASNVGEQFDWSPDGSTLVYTKIADTDGQPYGDIMTQALVTGAASGGPEQITGRTPLVTREPLHKDDWPRFSTRGSVIYFAHHVGGGTVYRYTRATRAFECINPGGTSSQGWQKPVAIAGMNDILASRFSEVSSEAGIWAFGPLFTPPKLMVPISSGSPTATTPDATHTLYDVEMGSTPSQIYAVSYAAGATPYRISTASSTERGARTLEVTR